MRRTKAVAANGGETYLDWNICVSKVDFHDEYNQYVVNAATYYVSPIETV